MREIKIHNKYPKLQTQKLFENKANSFLCYMRFSVSLTTKSANSQYCKQNSPNSDSKLCKCARKLSQKIAEISHFRHFHENWRITLKVTHVFKFGFSKSNVFLLLFQSIQICNKKVM